jgi:methyltransferase
VEAGPEPKCEATRRSEIPYYLGYEIQVSKRMLGDLASGNYYDLTVATSRTGAPLATEEERLKSKLAEARTMLVAFGNPRAGIQELLKRERLEVSGCFQFNLNTVPDQGTETVRTEEAIHATLAVLNLLP